MCARKKYALKWSLLNLNRLKASLIAPETLMQYKKDRLWTVLLYLSFFAFLTSIGPLVRSLTYTTLPSLTQDVILSELTLPESCVINGGEMMCETDEVLVMYDIGTIQAVIDLSGTETNDIRGFESLIRFEETQVTILTSQGVADAIPYQDLDLLNVSFDGTSQQNISSALRIINALVLYYRPVWTPVIMIARALGSLLVFLIFVLINAAFLKPRLKKTSFKELFVLMTYASTGLYLIWIFDALIPLNIFVFLLLLILAFRRSSRLAFALQAHEVSPLE